MSVAASVAASIATGVFAALLSMAAVQADPFGQFTFCRENPTGVYSRLCLDLDPAGEGTFTLEVRGDDDVERVAFAFSPGARRDFQKLLENTAYLEEADDYESGRNVANLGTKTIAVTGGWGRREAVFNYTTIREASDLATFFERLIAQEVLRFETDVSLEFDRLGIPDQLDKIENEVRARRIVDSGRIISMLDRIARDTRVINYARSNAERLAEDLRDEPDVD
jgi:hypothetical protein